jgi:hypothetical protein
MLSDPGTFRTPVCYSWIPVRSAACSIAHSVLRPASPPRTGLVSLTDCENADKIADSLTRPVTHTLPFLLAVSIMTDATAAATVRPQF